MSQASEGVGEDCLYRHIKDSKIYGNIYIFLSSNILMQITNQRLLSLHLHKVQLIYPREQILIAPFKSLLSSLYSGPPSGETSREDPKLGQELQ